MPNLQPTDIKLIACADIHLRDTIPICRIDDYWKAQNKKFNFLIDTAIQKNCNIYHAGDLFHKPKSSAYLEAWAIEKLKKLKKNKLKFITITGQHDVPNHNVKEIEKSSIWVLYQAEVIDLFITPYQEGVIIDNNIMMIHAMIHQDQPIHANIQSTKANSLLKKYPKIKIIISGDNHLPFIEHNKSNFLLNCGSMMRTTIDQINYSPHFYFIKNYYIVKIAYPISTNIMDVNQINKNKANNDRMEFFIEKINSDYEIDLSFEKNLENFFRKNKIRKGVQDTCWRAINE